MKSFLKYTLATIVGVIIASFVGILLLMGTLSAIVSFEESEVVVKDNSVLKLTLDRPIVDRGEENPLEDLNIPMFSNQSNIGMDDIISAIEKAKTNDNIKGIYIRTMQVQAGWAQLSEIRKALEEFKESGKFIYAYSEVYTQETYYLASVADKIMVTPEGNVMISGLSSQRTFYKNAMEKLGVEMQIVKVGKFKSAVEPYIRENMSRENREQTEVYLNSIWGNVVKAISESRNISEEDINKIADANTVFAPVNMLLEAKLIDGVIYEDEMLDMLRTKLDIETPKGIPTISVAKMKRVPMERKTKGLVKEKIAVIYAEGEIGMDMATGISGSSGIDGNKIAKEVRVARQDSSIKAIVIRVNSPGGSALASDLMWREIKLSADMKPTIVSMGNLAASGGYYMSCPADIIVANPMTITGSIGIFGTIPNAQELLEDKIGLNFDKVNTNEYSDFPQINRPMTKAERAMMQNMVNKGYETFIGHVAEGRSMTTTRVDEIGQGRVWTGENAIELGLVDTLGTLNDAIAIAQKEAGLENYRLVKLPKQEDPFEQLLKGASAQIKMSILEREIGYDNIKHYRTVQRAMTTKGVQARMEFDVVIE